MIFTFRTFAISLLAVVNLEAIALALNVPCNVFSTEDLKGADIRPIKNIYTFGDSYTDYRSDWNVQTYAISGATCDNLQQNQGSVDMAGQLGLFATRFHTSSVPLGLTDDPNTTVATLLIGGNDIILMQKKAWGTLPPVAFSNGSIEGTSLCIKSKLDMMHSLGFRRFVLFEMPPIDKSQRLGSTPEHAASTAALVKISNEQTKQHSTELLEKWNDGSTISIFPTVKLVEPMVELNSAYEFKHGRGNYCNLTCRDPFSYVWTDDIHLSTRAFQLLANAFVRFLDPDWKSGAIFSDLE
ncbi:hypothetical protein A4X09_0g5008 [Tilletia walkeri]|uniref:SGNH hydrolase-type esterase domain-containing protein n=1 Tax=Tilletia walkeri TaxID=117179 RepID=A0A8X7T414_9BASI|nr:hypothetical protein A4X09_0g5008 [Tilletia walkeri]